MLQGMRIAAFVIAFFKELKLSTFDPALATALGLAPTAMFYALLTLTSATAVAAFDAVGAVLYIAFVIVPPAAAYLLTDRLIPMLVLSAAIGMISSAAGYAVPGGDAGSVQVNLIGQGTFRCKPVGECDPGPLRIQSSESFFSLGGHLEFGNLKWILTPDSRRRIHQ
jgi:hypothetical protein